MFYCILRCNVFRRAFSNSTTPMPFLKSSRSINSNEWIVPLQATARDSLGRFWVCNSQTNFSHPHIMKTHPFTMLHSIRCGLKCPCDQSNQTLRRLCAMCSKWTLVSNFPRPIVAYLVFCLISRVTLTALLRLIQQLTLHHGVVFLNSHSAWGLISFASKWRHCLSPRITLITYQQFFVNKCRTGRESPCPIGLHPHIGYWGSWCWYIGSASHLVGLERGCSQWHFFPKQRRHGTIPCRLQWRVQNGRLLTGNIVYHSI